MSEKLLDDIFFVRNDLNQDKVKKLVADYLHGMDDGELYMEFSQSESLVYDDRHLRSSSFNTSHGFGLRAVLGEQSSYGYSSEISMPAFRRAGNLVKSVKTGKGGKKAVAGKTSSARKLYSEVNPLDEVPFDKKVKLLAEIDSYLRNKDKRVQQVSVSLAGEWQGIRIIKANGQVFSDIRPLVRISVSVVAAKGDRMERGSYGTGGREAYKNYMAESSWKKQADEALRQALVNLDSVPAPAGEMDVVLGPGWPGVMLHEAVGHGLEGDFNRKKVSAFSGLIGKRVASKGVTVIDDGTIPKRRGSLNMDDEGTPTNETVLIEDGILVGYMQDRLNARLISSR